MDKLNDAIQDLIKFTQDGNDCWLIHKSFLNHDVAKCLEGKILKLRKAYQDIKSNKVFDDKYYDHHCGSFYVFNPGNRSPTKLHANFASAHEEAVRLADNNPNQEFLVCQAIESNMCKIIKCPQTVIID